MYKALCIGEVLFDVIGEKHYLGGAPLNVAAHLSRLGIYTYMVSAVGSDSLGEIALSKMAHYKIDYRYVKALSLYRTGTAIVHPELDGHERFELPENVAYDFIEFSQSDLEEIKQIRPDAVVFGSLAQARSAVTRASIKSILDALPHAIKLFDANLRKAYYRSDIISSSLEGCTIFKLNDSELEIISYLLYGKAFGEKEFAARIFRDFQCEILIITKGKNGASAYRRDATCVSAPGINIIVVDTVGAGDAFSAAFLASWLENRNLKNALNAGNAAGAKTVAHAGAIT